MKAMIKVGLNERLAALIIAIIIEFPFFPDRMMAVVPAASFLTAIASLLATRTADWLTAIALPFFLLALFKGRWFCSHACPAGILFDTAGRLSPARNKLYRKLPHFDFFLLALIIGSAMVGVPLFLFLDPLALFGGLTVAMRSALEGQHRIFSAAGFLLVLLISAFFPHIWCERVCPLGAGQIVLGKIGNLISRKRIDEQTADGLNGEKEYLSPSGSDLFNRRSFLAMGCGAVVGLFFYSFARYSRSVVLRPPGSIAEPKFLTVCVRCGKCTQVCPEKIIRLDAGRGGILGLFSPYLDYSRGYCLQNCVKCTRVCPTVAITELSVAEKQVFRIGLANIDRTKCRAWGSAQQCALCYSQCPYNAITLTKARSVDCPIVSETECRGCGACQASCPVRPERAIVVFCRPQRI